MSGPSLFTRVLSRLTRREDLTSDEAADVMAVVMRGEAHPSQIAGLLVGLAMKGERPAELVGLARTMRREAVPAGPLPDGIVDTCGTGGDRSGTFNISTATAVVVAAAVCRWQSTATARCRADAAAPTCSRRWVFVSTHHLPWWPGVFVRPGWPSSSPRPFIRRCGTRSRHVEPSACRRRSTCLGH